MKAFAKSDVKSLTKNQWYKFSKVEKRAMCILLQV